jgi:hypothetical protein
VKANLAKRRGCGKKFLLWGLQVKRGGWTPLRMDFAAMPFAHGTSDARIKKRCPATALQIQATDCVGRRDRVD